MRLKIPPDVAVFSTEALASCWGVTARTLNNYREACEDHFKQTGEPRSLARTGGKMTALCGRTPLFSRQTALILIEFIKAKMESSNEQ